MVPVLGTSMVHYTQPIQLIFIPSLATTFHHQYHHTQFSHHNSQCQQQKLLMSADTAVHIWTLGNKGKGKVCHCWAIARVMRLISAGAYPGFNSIKRLGVLLPLDGMLVHRRIPPQLLLVPILLLGGEKQSK